MVSHDMNNTESLSGWQAHKRRRLRQSQMESLAESRLGEGTFLRQSLCPALPLKKTGQRLF
jgi:hypothetical protein